ncbi:hypothetical protein J5N97_011986 [Dioscorea zingiberensis]|uniref:Uncharacterized protein n=1 Tax=Dioscorea zingiberensis TaxID=325984 RepID=A0A9D5CQ96_9LILI|nr:hypothetical protein J5N97_011986 [Dioscorea zingiberensis]
MCGWDALLLLGMHFEFGVLKSMICSSALGAYSKAIKYLQWHIWLTLFYSKPIITSHHLCDESWLQFCAEIFYETVRFVSVNIFGSPFAQPVRFCSSKSSSVVWVPISSFDGGLLNNLFPFGDGSL